MHSHDNRGPRSHKRNRFKNWKHTFSSVKAVLSSQATGSKNSHNQINKLHYFTLIEGIKAFLLIF